MEKVRPVILIICDYYLPGFESGGAMRTLVNMVDRLSDEFEFKIITRDHDGPLNLKTYSTVSIDDWNRVGNADVYYLAKSSVRLSTIRDLVGKVKSDGLYLNSFFSPLTISTLLLRRFGDTGHVPIILAPEGELVRGALSIKPLKKRLYILFAKLLSLLDKITWKAASEYEKAAIESLFGSQASLFIAPNMPPREIVPRPDPRQKPTKLSGQAKFIFLSRFMRKKNLNWFLEQLRDVPGDICIDIWGPIEDSAYLEECRAIVRTLPQNVRVEEKGAVSHEEVAKTLTNYHFFVLPTLGENFGHIFVEALAAGCPLVISDRSPWRDLEGEGIGWDIPLEEPEIWRSVIGSCIKMSSDEYSEMSDRARNYALNWLSDPIQERSNREVLRAALGIAH